MQYGSKANLSTKSCSDISELEKKLVREIAQKLCKKFLKRKKLLEILEVAKKLPSSFWKALGRREGEWEATQ